MNNQCLTCGQKSNSPASDTKKGQIGVCLVANPSTLHKLMSQLRLMFKNNLKYNFFNNNNGDDYE